MRAIPITLIGDTLTLYAVFEIARFRLRQPSLNALRAGPLALAFEPRNFDDTPLPDLYEISVPLPRLILVGMAPDWNRHLLDTARKVGAWAARRHTARSAPPDAPAFGPPQPRMQLRKIFSQMQATNTAVAGFALTKPYRREDTAAVLIEGFHATTEMRRRLDLSEHTTLTFLATERGWRM